jgi:hypothetical protein
MSSSETRWLIWCLIAATAVATVAAYRITGTSFVAGPLPVLSPLLIASLLGICWFYSRVRPDPWIAAGSEVAAQLILIAGLSALLDFAVAAGGAGFAYRESLLAAWDRAIGFDFLSYVAFVDARPAIQPLMKACYLSIDFTYLVVVVALLTDGDRKRLDRFIIALWASLMLTMAVFLFMPAIGAYAYFGVRLDDLRALHPTFLANHFVPLLREMRQAGPHVVRFNDLEGLVSFPSFHAAAAILFTWAVWPCRWVRWPMLAVNTVMVVMAPVEGAHYLVDIVAGSMVAVAAIGMARVLEGRCPQALRPGPSRFATAVRASPP